MRWWWFDCVGQWWWDLGLIMLVGGAGFGIYWSVVVAMVLGFGFDCGSGSGGGGFGIWV